MKPLVLALSALLLIPTLAPARSGCCSHHHGVARCNEATGYWQCLDGTDSPSCRCKDGRDVGSPAPKKRHRARLPLTR